MPGGRGGNRRSAKALLTELRGLGYTGGYTVLTDFIRGWRLGVGANAPSRAFVPLKFALGEAFQFDWSEEGLVVGGIYYRLQVAHMKLCATRARATRCCLMPTRGALRHWAAFRGAGSTTT